MATSSINVNSFAWRLITGKEIKIDESLHLDTTNASSSSSSPQKTQYFPPYPPSLLTKSGIVDEDHIFQLKAIFMHFDTNKDGYISYEQLCSALTYLGLPTREKFIKKFCSPMSTLKNNPSKLSYSNNIDEKMSTTSSLNQRKVHGHIILNFNTDLKTFIMTIGKCINEFKQQKKMLEELFTFMLPDENPFGINAPPVISRASVTHLLRDISTGTSFNGQDAGKFLYYHLLSFDYN